MIENGLVICSNLRTGGMAAMLGGRGGTMTPRDIKVLVGEDTEGVAAKLIARDSELDLAWVKVNEDKLPKDHPFAFVDFSKSAAVEVGDTLVTVARLGKFFDRASFSHDTRALGMIKKPRKLIYAHTEDYGAPAFAASGDPVGVVIFQTPSREDMEGGEGGDQERGGLVILPGAEVIAATVKAKEAAASGKPVDPPAPALPKTEPDSAKAPQGEPAPAPK
jgi:hypothetical protein